MRLVVAALFLTLALPAAAQDTPPAEPRGDMGEGMELLGEGARLLLRGLMAEMEPALRGLGQDIAALRPVLEDLARMIGDVRNYHAPEMLPNGDIIIRRRPPLAPTEPGAEPGEIEL
ncbi:MAG: AAA+ family ATPase [Gemmobacter sp.]